MAHVRYYVALPFTMTDDGTLAAGQPVEAQSQSAAISSAQRLAKAEGGAVAFTRTGDPDTGDFSDAEVLGKFGIVPDDLSEL